jgi:NADPH-dependent glutamate synthase beta subunit-like oxidoreductase
MSPPKMALRHSRLRGLMDSPGENLNGVYSANEYPRRNNLTKAFEFPNADTPPPAAAPAAPAAK